MPSGNQKWDTTAELDLCVAMIQGNNDESRAKHNWPAIHAFMSKLGYNFTKDAVSQHFTKSIMRSFKKRYPGADTPLETGTPAKGKAKKPAAASTGRAGPSKRSRALKDESDDEVDEASTKKKIKKQAEVKDEDDDNRQVRERSLTVQRDFENWYNAATEE